VVASQAGYFAYFNNVTIQPGSSALVVISLNPVGSNATTSSNTLTGTTVALVGGLGVLAVIFLVGMVYYWSKSRQPPARPPAAEPSSPPS